MKKNIEPRDKDGKPHGYWEEYTYQSDNLWYSGHYNHGELVGLWLWYQNGKVYSKEYGIT